MTNEVALCMPVGPRGVLAPTAQLLCAITSAGIASRIMLATGHLCRARNVLISTAVERGSDRVIWLDSDVWVEDLDELARFIARAEQAFADDNLLVWVSAVCAMRGDSGPNYRPAPYEPPPPYPAHYEPPPYPVYWAGLGLQYWRVPRYVAAGAPPFRWVEPLSEDYRMCDDIHRAGFRGRIDRQLATVHDGLRAGPRRDNGGAKGDTIMAAPKETR